MNDFLSSEKIVINDAELYLKEFEEENTLQKDNFEKLLLAYKKLNKEQNRLIKLSDKSQKKLNIANSKLELFSKKLSKYFSPQVYDSLFSGELDVNINTKRKLLTIFFSDLEGFTELTERLEPEILTELLTNYLTEMSIIANKWGGTIDKYIGDAIMIFFGDPTSNGEKEDAKKCISMALDMLEQLKILRNHWKNKGLTMPLNAKLEYIQQFALLEILVLKTVSTTQ